MPAEQRIKVLVCHDSPVLQAGLMATLARHEDLDCAEDDGSALSRGRTALPDVIIADHCTGIKLVGAASKVASVHARPSVLIVTHSDRECDIRTALSAGVQGYLLVDDVPEHLAAAIRAVRPGARILSPRVASRLAENVAGEALTHREEVVLCLVVEGLCNKSIGSRLGIASGTVKSHLRAIFTKLGATSRTHAIHIAQRRGLLQPQEAASHRGERAEASARVPLFNSHAARSLPALASHPI